MAESHALKTLRTLRGDLDNEITLLDERRRALVLKIRVNVRRTDFAAEECVVNLERGEFPRFPPDAGQ